MKSCANCGLPTGRNPWATFCLPCLGERERQGARLSAQRYNASAKGKLTKYRYDQRHKEERKGRQRAYFRRTHPSPVGQIRQCATALCDGTFVHKRWGGHRKFCDDCRIAFGLVRAA